ncbi:MAG: ClpXP protease specificity-enhancing factor [Wenzhouxiangella sp.]
MKSSRPYLIRAMCDWISDSGLTPHLIADANRPGVTVPPQAVQDGKVVLNVSPSAVRDLFIDDDMVSFVARFGGVSRAVSVATSAVLAVYARENGRGMMFSDDPETVAVDESSDAGPALSKVSGPKGKSRQDDSEPPEPPDGPDRGGPRLRIVK